MEYVSSLLIAYNYKTIAECHGHAILKLEYSFQWYFCVFVVLSYEFKIQRC